MSDPWAFSELQPQPEKLKAGPQSELHAAWSSWQQSPTPATMSTLLKQASPIITTGIHRYGGGSAGSPNLAGHAKRLAIAAFENYSPERGDLKTHLLGRLQGLQRIAARSSQPIQLPEQLALRYHHMVQSETDFRDEFGRDPSDAELSGRLGLSLPRLKKLRGYNQSMAEGQLPEGVTVGNPGATDRAGADAWLDYLYHDQSPTDQVIIDFTLGRNGSPRLSTSEIAKRLGITAGAVSQRTAKLQQLINSRHELSFL